MCQHKNTSLNDLRNIEFIQNVYSNIHFRKLVTKYDFNIGRQIAESGVSYSVSPAISEINNLEKLNLFIRKNYQMNQKICAIMQQHFCLGQGILN